MFNDEFLVEMETSDSPGKFQNIAFDMQHNPVTVNAGFFTVCQNYSLPQTMHCTQPVSQLDGTGYEDPDDPSTGGVNAPVGGSTGWLTTTAPVPPGKEITLRFVIFDEGDHIFDSAVIVDNFKWSVQGVSGPTTIQ
jgi:hypothetical protein